MTTGRTNPFLEAIIVVEMLDGDGNLHPFESILDTGFDGALALPAIAIRRLGLTHAGHRRIVLGDGRPVEAEAYIGRIIWLGEPLRITVLQTGGDPVIGTYLLEGCTVTIQVWDGGEVLIQERA